MKALIIIIIVFSSAQYCLANEPTYDGKPLFIVGPIVHPNGTRSLSGQSYNRPTAAVMSLGLVMKVFGTTKVK